MNESITSASKREGKLTDAAAAISVLSNDDLHRSGATTIMVALRLVPGLDVASINSDQWVISARGFNSLYANKLLESFQNSAPRHQVTLRSSPDFSKQV